MSLIILMCIPDATMLNFFNALNVEIDLFFLFFFFGSQNANTLSRHVTAVHSKTHLLNFRLQKRTCVVI